MNAPLAHVGDAAIELRIPRVMPTRVGRRIVVVLDGRNGERSGDIADTRAQDLEQRTDLGVLAEEVLTHCPHAGLAL